ncbi:TPA: hypothetical protein ACHUB4_002896 [Escherichia coli]
MLDCEVNIDESVFKINGENHILSFNEMLIVQYLYESGGGQKSYGNNGSVLAG